MNFNSHQKKLLQSIDVACIKPKKELVGEFFSILTNANKLYKTSDFDFWLKALGTIPFEQIPMTEYGHAEALSKLSYIRGRTRNEVWSGLLNLCENLFTYTFDDGHFSIHSYYDLEAGEVVQKSELFGIGSKVVRCDSELRIAKVSEIEFVEETLYQ